MARRYWVDIPPTDVTGPIDLLQIVPASGYPVKVVSVQLGQTSDFGDAQFENLVLIWVRGHTTLGSGGTSVTPTPNSSPGSAAQFTAKYCNTTIASAGTPVNGPRHCFSVTSRGVESQSALGQQFEATSADGSLVLRIIDANAGTAPLDSITFHGSICIEEAP